MASFPDQIPRYAELQVTTNFSFLRGAAHPDELVVTAAALGHAAIAITDRNSLAGIVRAAYSLATGWEMKKKAPLARPHAFAHLYELSPSGTLAVVELNIPLLAPDEPDPYDPHDG